MKHASGLTQQPLAKKIPERLEHHPEPIHCLKACTLALADISYTERLPFLATGDLNQGIPAGYFK
jgi:hypothetical protein